MGKKTQQEIAETFGQMQETAKAQSSETPPSKDEPKQSTGPAKIRTPTKQQATEERRRKARLKAVKLTCLADVEPRPLRWLWRDRIPLGKLTMLDGDPGLGKSLITIDVAARVSTHRPMPDETLSDLGEPASVVLLSAEDDTADTIQPRLAAAGADMARIRKMDAIIHGDDESLPSLGDCSLIPDALQEYGAKLLIIDPLMAYLPSEVNSFRDQDIRRILAPLAKIAAETGAAVVIIRHLNKSPGGNALYRGGGSIGIIGAARSGLLVAPDPDDSERKILAVTKSNLAKIPAALAYRIQENSDKVSFLTWEGPTNHTATSLLATPFDGEGHSSLEEAKHFLREVLADGPVAAKEVEKQANQASISYATLRRAKAALQIKAEKRGGFFGGKKESQQWCWVLPPEDAQSPPEDAQSPKDEHLQQSSEKNTRNFNGVPEDAQSSKDERLKGNDEHLQQSWEEEV
ncbi:MAG: AAA family ATPase [Deltaproteobacteria bacterium]|nr:AAA family ATPase [Deltaproteobacteria bacterium]